MKTIREILFRGFNGCTNHSCVIKKPKGMGTNGRCACLHNFSRNQLSILASRIDVIGDKEVSHE